MGYILPITQHTYKNYQYRMVEKSKGPHHIGATYKAVFHKIDEKHRNKEEHIHKNKLNDDNKTESRRRIPAYQIHSLQKAELTGKGGQVNEQV